MRWAVHFVKYWEKGSTAIRRLAIDGTARIAREYVDVLERLEEH